MNFVVLAASSAMLHRVQQSVEPISFLHHRADTFVPAVRDFKDELFVVASFHDLSLQRLAVDVLAPRSPAVVVCGDERFAEVSAQPAAELDVPLITEASPTTWIEQARRTSEARTIVQGAERS
ncbi:hypothetical protein [Streptomyces sp. NPDC056672]|uniref:hypothetical protein n=1 Tax=Streptomyces sp. NPDC056672 TaxID=3345906 RepID=UPI0036A5C3A3